MKNYFGPRHHEFVTFAPHLPHQNGDLHFSSRTDFKCAGRFGIAYLKRNVGSRFTNQAFANLPCSHELSVAARKRRIVDENLHADCWRIDIDELKWRAL